MKYEMIDCPECRGDGHRVYNPLDPMCRDCNGAGEIKSDYLIIDDPTEAVLFLGKEVTFINPDNYIWKSLFYGLSEDGYDDENGNNAEKIKVHKSVVKKVCEPKEGDAGVFVIDPFKKDSECPDYWYSFNDAALCCHAEAIIIKNNALTDGKSCGEIKKLIDYLTT